MSLIPADMAVDSDPLRRIAALERRLAQMTARDSAPAAYRLVQGVVRWGCTAAGTTDLSEARLTTAYGGATGSGAMVWVDAPYSAPPAHLITSLPVPLILTGRTASRAGKVRPLCRVAPSNLYQLSGYNCLSHTEVEVATVLDTWRIRCKSLDYSGAFTGADWQDTDSYFDLYVPASAVDPVYVAGDRLRMPLGLAAWPLVDNGRCYLRPDYIVRPRRVINYNGGGFPADRGEVIEVALGIKTRLWTNGVVARWNSISLGSASNACVTSINFVAQTYGTTAIDRVTGGTESQSNLTLGTTGNVSTGSGLTLTRDAYRRTTGITGGTYAQFIIGGCMDGWT